MSIKKRSVAIAVTLLVSASLFIPVFAKPAADGTMRDITTQELVRDMGLGVNLGNTFESNGDWIEGSTPADYETAWGSPQITRAIIAQYPLSGFKTVRLPVHWSNLMEGNSPGGTYTISAAYMDRVQEVVDWILEEDMYVILNMHHENWISKALPNDSAETMRKYLRIWEQVAERFKDYGDHLMFESLNEEGQWEEFWYEWGAAGAPNDRSNTANKERAFGFLNALNQNFVNLVRASGGNNGQRHFLIAGYKTDRELTSDPLFRMPDDPAARCAVSIHYYDPFGFTHLHQDEDWESLKMTWGTQAEINYLNTEMDKLKTNFVDKGIPVIVGEYGVAFGAWGVGLAREQSEVRKYTLAVAKAIYDRNMLSVLWDVQLNPPSEPIYYFNRRIPEYTDRELVAGFFEITGTTPPPVSVRYGNSRNVNSAAARPMVALRGRMLNVSSPDNSALTVRMIDTRGRVRARFDAKGNGNFSLVKIPAGRYFIDVRGVGVRETLPVIIK